MNNHIFWRIASFGILKKDHSLFLFLVSLCIFCFKFWLSFDYDILFQMYMTYMLYQAIAGVATLTVSTFKILKFWGTALSWYCFYVHYAPVRMLIKTSINIQHRWFHIFTTKPPNLLIQVLFLSSYPYQHQCYLRFLFSLIFIYLQNLNYSLLGLTPPHLNELFLCLQSQQAISPSTSTHMKHHQASSHCHFDWRVGMGPLACYSVFIKK